MKCKLVDVFAKEKLAGNGLTIFYDYDSLTKNEMQSLTREMRQFESIFVTTKGDNLSVRANIFTIEEELDFAGHPIIGLAAHLHEESGDVEPREWTIDLNKKSVRVKTKKTEKYFHAAMAQGTPEYIHTLTPSEADKVLAALSLSAKNLADYPLEVISTGLPYVIVPITSGIENAKICISDFDSLLESFGAKFAYVIDINNFEARTWDNQGSVEDIATGSAAGPAVAFLVKYEIAAFNTPIIISQGRFLARPSKIETYVEVTEDTAVPMVSNIWVSGDVVKVANIDFI